jgi:hypothetical protein
MFTKRQEQPSLTAPPEERRFTDPSVPSRACCCPARPAVKVIMPPAPGRPHSVDLWLCGHHYHVSLAALAAAHAVVEDLTLPKGQPHDDRAPATIHMG